MGRLRGDAGTNCVSPLVGCVASGVGDCSEMDDWQDANSSGPARTATMTGQPASLHVSNSTNTHGVTPHSEDFHRPSARHHD